MKKEDVIKKIKKEIPPYLLHSIEPLLQEMEKKTQTDLLEPLTRRNGAAILTETLTKKFLPEEVSKPNSDEQRSWELLGLFYFYQGHFYEALPIFKKLYYQMLTAQQKNNNWVHKGMPLVWISDCYSSIGFRSLAKRYLMLTLCEDAIREEGNIATETGGVYFRLVWNFGLPDAEVKKYANKIYKLRADNIMDSRFPEWILQQLDQNWIAEFPKLNEALIYDTNSLYIKQLISKLGEPTGIILEKLSGYLLSCMPGCRTYLRKRSMSTDYDIVCSMEGAQVDFRSELGRYFVCECKDWNEPANFTTMAKFCRVLDSIKSRFGILFSEEGLSGKNKTRYAEREQLKVFQDRGMVIVVIDNDDLHHIADGGNFINLLRNKYERVRLDLSN